MMASDSQGEGGHSGLAGDGHACGQPRPDFGRLGAAAGLGSREGGGCRLNLLMSYAGWQGQTWSDQIPRLLDPMGIRSHWASCGREATRVIQSTPIHIAIVDLGLPLDARDEEGEAGSRLLDVLARLSPTPPTIVMKRNRTTRDDLREMSAALRAGAFAIMDRPRTLADIETLLQVLRRVLERHYGGRWPGGGATSGGPEPHSQ